MKIALGTDHAGFELKEAIKVYLDGLGHEVFDAGAFEYDKADDYPDFIVPAADAVSTGAMDCGIIFGGSGQGEAIVANKFPNVRAAVWYGGEDDIVPLSRTHNDANILSIGARFISKEEAIHAITVWLQTLFEPETRHVRRLNEITAVEKSIRFKYPQIGVAAILCREGKVLMGRRKGSHSDGTWAFPGGHLEFGESIPECAIREVEEETGIVISDVFSGPYENTLFPEEYRHYLTVFSVSTIPNGVEPENREPERCEGWKWFSWDALPEPLFPSVVLLKQTPFNPFTI